MFDSQLESMCGRNGWDAYGFRLSLYKSLYRSRGAYSARAVDRTMKRLRMALRDKQLSPARRSELEKHLKGFSRFASDHAVHRATKRL